MVRAVATFVVLFGGGCGEEPAAPKRAREAPAPLVLPPREGPSPVRFVDATAEAGVTFVHDFGVAAQEWRYVETLGSGVVAFDGDGDGDVDLLFLNGRGFGPKAEPARGNSYWRNEGGWRFVDATAESGLAALEGGGTFALGGAAADYDNDGDADLYVVNFDGANSLWRNDGRGRFVDVAAAAGVAGRLATLDSACAFGDVDGDGWLDLFVAGSMEQPLAKERECFDSEWQVPDSRLRRYCHPTDFEPSRLSLFLANGDGTFREATEAAGLAEFRGRTLGARFVDVDDDRDADLFIVCDRTANALWINDGAGHFTDVALRAGVAYDSSGRAKGGMGLAAGDYDGDGRIDLLATYFERESNGLYRQLPGDGTAEARDASGGAGAGTGAATGGVAFTDAALESNTANASFATIGWGTELLDADLDGQLDWVVVNGHVNPGIERMRRPGSTLGWEQPLLFFLNRGGGKFESLGAEAGPPFTRELPARGLAVADFDADGDLDLAIGTNGAAALLLRNDSPRADRHWLRVRTVGTKSNRDGLGARVIVEAGGRRQLREIHCGGSYLSNHDRRAHFGLGSATVVDRLDVRWPSGQTTTLTALAADQELTVTEP